MEPATGICTIEAKRGVERAWKRKFFAPFRGVNGPGNSGVQAPAGQRKGKARANRLEPFKRRSRGF